MAHETERLDSKNAKDDLYKRSSLSQIVMAGQLDTKRRKRIEDEIIVDTYGEDEEMSAWHCYLEDNLEFPFTAICEKESELCLLKKGEKITVIKMAGIDACYHGMSVIVRWTDRQFAIPLELLKSVEKNAETTEAIEDWKFWLNGMK